MELVTKGNGNNNDKNDKLMNSNESRLEHITIELFNSLRGCYNKGNSELQTTIFFLFFYNILKFKNFIYCNRLL